MNNGDRIDRIDRIDRGVLTYDCHPDNLPNEYKLRYDRYLPMMNGTGQSNSKSANNSSPMSRGSRGMYGDIHLKGYSKAQNASATAVRFVAQDEINRTFSSWMSWKNTFNRLLGSRHAKRVFIVPPLKNIRVNLLTTLR